jgi:hypothetical protein
VYSRQNWYFEALILQYYFKLPSEVTEVADLGNSCKSHTEQCLKAYIICFIPESGSPSHSSFVDLIHLRDASLHSFMILVPPESCFIVFIHESGCVAVIQPVYIKEA